MTIHSFDSRRQPTNLCHFVHSASTSQWLLPSVAHSSNLARLDDRLSTHDTLQPITIDCWQSFFQAIIAAIWNICLCLYTTLYHFYQDDNPLASLSNNDAIPPSSKASLGEILASADSTLTDKGEREAIDAYQRALRHCAGDKLTTLLNRRDLNLAQGLFYAGSQLFTNRSSDDLVRQTFKVHYQHGQLSSYAISPKRASSNSNPRYLILFPDESQFCEQQLDICQQYAQQGCYVTTFNYPGVGLSTGQSHSKQALIAAGIAQVQRLLAQNIAAERLYLKGSGIGGTVARAVAEHFRNQGYTNLKLITHQPIYDLTIRRIHARLLEIRQICLRLTEHLARFYFLCRGDCYLPFAYHSSPAKVTLLPYYHLSNLPRTDRQACDSDDENSSEVERLVYTYPFDGNFYLFVPALTQENKAVVISQLRGALKRINTVENNIDEDLSPVINLHPQLTQRQICPSNHQAFPSRNTFYSKAIDFNVQPTTLLEQLIFTVYQTIMTLYLSGWRFTSHSVTSETNSHRLWRTDNTLDIQHPHDWQSPLKHPDACTYWSLPVYDEASLVPIGEQSEATPIETIESNFLATPPSLH